MNSEKVVKLFNVWTDKKEFVYIQMELCKCNLMDFLIAKMNGFKRKFDQPMNDIEYFISISILKEICQGVQYLHGLTPKIIHRDLKPKNVLITNSNNGNFVKLSDFGLSIYHEQNMSSHTSGVGTNIYKAPEVNGRHYNEKVDIFSLAVMALVVMGFNVKEDLKTYGTYDRQ